jgi:hypothetical protein
MKFACQIVFAIAMIFTLPTLSLAAPAADIFGNSETVAILRTTNYTTNITATAVDVRDYTGEARLIIGLWANGSGCAATLKIQESDASGSGFGDVGGLTLSATNSQQVSSFRVPLASRKRYLRAVLTKHAGGTTANIASSVFLIAKPERSGTF